MDLVKGRRNLKTNLQRILKRLDRELSGPIVEFSEQFLYGHREILIDYANLPDNSLIRGSIEHGWALDSGYGIRKLTGGRNIYLSWSSDRVNRSRINSDRTIPLGAPFAYLVERLGPKLQKPPKYPNRIMYFPLHGNEYSQQNAENQISIFKSRYDPKNATACLYWVEFVNPRIRQLYEAAGFDVVCAGFSGQMEHTGLGYSARRLAGSPIGGRPSFLVNTAHFLTDYGTLVMGGLGSICFYAAYLRKDFELLDEYYDAEILDMNFEYRIPYKDKPGEARYRNFVEEKLGMKFSDINFSSEDFRILAERELGKQDLKSPSELRLLLKNELEYSANPQSIQVYRDSIEEW